MPLLLPLLLLAFLVLWVLLLPLVWWQRYRRGTQRRRLVPWAARLNAWLMLMPLALFLASAALSNLWLDQAFVHAIAGLTVGIALSVVGLRLTRFESTAQGDYYTPSRWLTLALSVLIVARLLFGVWRARHMWLTSGTASEILLDQSDLFAIGGLLLGYYAGYAWGLRRRISRLHAH